MKISIDAFNIALTHGTGVASYGRNLVHAATGLGHHPAILFGANVSHSKVALLNEIALAEGNPHEERRAPLAILARDALHGLKGVFSAHAAREISLSGRVILPYNLQLDAARFWNVQSLYRTADIAFRATGAFTRAKLPDIDLAHWTYPLPVRIPGARNVYTLHDLVPLRLPYTTADVKRSYYRLCKRIARDADHIITVSECSRRDIIEILGVEEARVTNLYQSSDVGKMLGDISQDEIARYVEGLLGVGLREYFLFFGAIEPKKNIARLLEAYLGSGSRTPLVIVGAPGWGSERDTKLLKSMTALDTRRRIIWLGYLPREMLVRLISGARATFFPSLYEGFGLPVLESMALGTPVITSAGSSLGEVGGDAAYYVDPYDVRSIAAAIIALDSDADLRAERAARGIQQAERFSLRAYQDRLADLYRTLG